MALLSVYPLALAQEPTAIPVEVTAEPGGGLIDQIPPEVVTAVIDNALATKDVMIAVLIVSLVAVAFVAFGLLYRSAPPLLQGILGDLAMFGMGVIVDEVERRRDEAVKTPATWDDATLNALLTWLQDRKGGLDDLLNTPTPPQEPQEPQEPQG
jgi:hypothetical protein